MLRETEKFKNSLIEYQVNRSKAFFHHSRYILPVLFVSFWFIDLLFVPQQKWQFLALRLGFIPPVLLLYYFSTRCLSIQHLRRMGVLYAAISSLIINTMIFLSQDISNPYYAGLNLVALCSFLFISQSRRYFIFLCLVIYAPYVAIELFNISNNHSIMPLLLNGSFIVGTVIIGVLASHISKTLESKYIESQCLLQNELEQRESIIELKTKESLILERLSSQFSPQVIDAIKSGHRKISNTRQRSEICAIFVDVVGSTDRLLRLDHSQFVETIEYFMEICINTLLKYDLTIDKFYGDGVLAFSNDPVRRIDYVERTCRAAIDIRDQIHNEQAFLRRRWKKPFEITVGIAKGYASVGFYGNSTYIKQYSAIGACLAQSQRLSHLAAPMEILVDQDVEDVIQRAEFELEKKGEFSLKGFGEDLFQIFNIVGQGADHKTPTNFDVSCKSCHENSVYIDERDGLYVLKCRKCGFVENNQIIKSSQKAA